jgi:hypothetical protein
MKPKPRQLDLDLEAIESLRHMVHAAASTVDDLAKRLAPQTAELSSRIVLQHCERALRIARGAPMNPQSRARIDATYKMVQRELAA